MQQYCIALQHQPPPTIYAQQFQQCVSNNRRGLSRCTGSGRGRGYQNLGYQQPTSAPIMCAPTPYKQFKNWHYCSTHGGNIKDTHTGAICTKPGSLHNWQASSTNTMGGLTANMHKTILPPVSGRAPPVARAPQFQRPPALLAWQPPPPTVNVTQSMVAMHLPVPY